ncbi:CynX/NimT family MFS transporter [Domibacillus iocasae]|uniref:Transporter n=1 Tax=Domibacillus iocasae TaxID=1714016 RepID=A0A1E7DTH3_9BACI|nr:MFS transporter [Domibacillus iocasae]OES46361.1 transporter [Domibacillus iocasae]
MNSQIYQREQERSKTGQLFLLFSIILLALNMRSPITSVGPLTTIIRDDLNLSSTAAGALTTIPLLAFAVLSPFASKLARKFGMEVVLFGGLLVLTAGLLLRPAGSVVGLFSGTVLIGLAIALCNVLIPALVKLNFAHQIGLMTGFYATSMNLSGALASGFSIPIAASSDLGWRAALGFSVILACAAILVWLTQWRYIRHPLKAGQSTYKKTSLKGSALAWKVTAFMGIQSLLFYSFVAWLPDILQEQGLSAGSAGWMLSIVQFTQLPFTFIVPILAGRMKNQQPLVIVAALFMMMGLSGILFEWTEWVLIWVMLIGAAGGCAFSLAMMFFSLRTRNSFEAADLSGMAQSAGYLFAALGPALFGALHDMMNGWTVPLLLLIAAVIGLFIAGMGAGKEGYVTEKP